MGGRGSGRGKNANSSRRGRKDAAAARSTPARTKKEPDETPNPHKRIRPNSPPDNAISAFRNPFGPSANVPLTDSVNDPTRPQNQTHTYVPPDQITYGYTPELSVDQLVNFHSNSVASSSKLNPRTPSVPSDMSPAPSEFLPIDPSLTEPNPFNVSGPVFPSPPNLFAPGQPTPSSSSPFVSFKAFPQAVKPLFTPNSHRPASPAPMPASEHQHFPRIPKAFTDKITDHESRITDVEDLCRQTERLLLNSNEAHTARIDNIFRSTVDIMKDLDNEERNAEQRIMVLEEQVEKQAKQIAKLLDAITHGKLDTEVEKTVQKSKGNRDNSLNTAIRRCMLVAMGLSQTTKLKDAAAVPPGKSGGGYIKDPESTGKLLRPDWRLTFVDNSGWHDSMIRFVRAKAPIVLPAIRKADIKEKSDELILGRLDVVFKNIVSEYRKAMKQAEQLAQNDGEELAEGDEGRANRRRTRKSRKCEERKVTIAEGKIDIPPEWNWFLQPIYQSTDESDDADVVDPDTDTEEADEVPAASTRKPWITHPPLYRSAPFNNGVNTIDQALMERRLRLTKDNRGKTSSHPRMRVEAKDKPLPFVSSKSTLRIRRPAIDPTWLAAHPDQDTPSRIHLSDDEGAEVEVEVEVDADADVDAEMGDNEESDTEKDVQETDE
ncbi:hypothetical protein DFH06DRAFT_1474510 [Mycena polygramma]|nr:hypothetical protein DFH06DRAFT_1474510 [Mycena polygramma]